MQDLGIMLNGKEQKPEQREGSKIKNDDQGREVKRMMTPEAKKALDKYNKRDLLNYEPLLIVHQKNDQGGKIKGSI